MEPSLRSTHKHPAESKPARVGVRIPSVSPSTLRQNRFWQADDAWEGPDGFGTVNAFTSSITAAIEKVACQDQKRLDRASNSAMPSILPLDSIGQQSSGGYGLFDMSVESPDPCNFRYQEDPVIQREFDRSLSPMQFSPLRIPEIDMKID